MQTTYTNTFQETTFDMCCHHKSVDGLDKQSGFSIAPVAPLPLKELMTLTVLEGYQYLVLKTQKPMHVWMSLDLTLKSQVKEVEMMLSLMHKTAKADHPLVLTIQILKIPHCYKTYDHCKDSLLHLIWKLI